MHDQLLTRERKMFEWLDAAFGSRGLGPTVCHLIFSFVPISAGRRRELPVAKVTDVL